MRFGIAAAVVAALVYGVGWERVAENLAATDASLFLPAVAASLLGMAVGAEGLRVAIGVSRGSPDGWLARYAALAGTFLRSVLPAGGVGKGAFVAYTVGRGGTTSASRAVAGVASWEALNVLASATVAAAGLVGVLAAGRDAGTAPVVVGAFGSVLVAAVAAGGLVVRHRAVVVDLVLWAARVGRLLPRVDPSLDRERVRGTLDALLGNVAALARDRRRLGLAATAAHASWLLSVLALYLCLHAVALPVAPPAALVALPMAGFARAVPVPGGLGPMDAALGGILAVLTGYSLGALASALVLFRVATYGTRVVVGGAALWRLDVALR